ncbi:MAG: hypothetical protein R3F34_01460 [Planctomycetota bacterium]
MNTRTIGIVLAAAWVAALVWLLAVWGGDDDAPGRSDDSGGGDVALDAASDAPSGTPQETGSDANAADGGNGTATAPGESEPTVGAQGVAPPEVVESDVDPPAPPTEPDAYERKVLKSVFDPLERASERYAKHESLDESRLFGEDQESNQAAIDELLDAAIEALGISAVNETRSRLREIRDSVDAAEDRLSRDREARLSAPFESELNAVEKPFTTTREDYDSRIRDNEEAIARLERERVQLEERFVDELRGIGLDISRETARGLLSTVSGEDFVEMCVVFHNVRLVTVRLQQLTEEAGESLDVAKRYYGSYVVLVRILDTIQKDFVKRVRDVQIPRLQEYGERARENIVQAKRNAKTGGDPAIAEQNVRSNQLTLDACQAYVRYLQDQAAAVERQNEALQPRLRDAMNTYETVQLSSQVANAIREARRNFAALLELEVPDLRGFENVELQQEFERLTDRLLEP